GVRSGCRTRRGRAGAGGCFGPPPGGSFTATFRTGSRSTTLTGSGADLGWAERWRSPQTTSPTWTGGAPRDGSRDRPRGSWIWNRDGLASPPTTLDMGRGPYDNIGRIGRYIRPRMFVRPVPDPGRPAVVRSGARPRNRPRPVRPEV